MAHDPLEDSQHDRREIKAELRDLRAKLDAKMEAVGERIANAIASVSERVIRLELEGDALRERLKAIELAAAEEKRDEARSRRTWQARAWDVFKTLALAYACVRLSLPHVGG